MSRLDLDSLVVGILSAESKMSAVFRLICQKSGRGNDLELKTKFLLLMVGNAGPEVENLLNLPHRQTCVAGSYTRG
jgi:hypothetical protein